MVELWVNFHFLSTGVFDKCTKAAHQCGHLPPAVLPLAGKTASHPNSFCDIVCTYFLVLPRTIRGCRSSTSLSRSLASQNYNIKNVLHDDNDHAVSKFVQEAFYTSRDCDHVTSLFSAHVDKMIT
jgi:hypothetical protein